MNSAETRELLELAAKAYGGLEYEPHDGWVHTGEHGKRGARWDPLDDDGDALRLAVALRAVEPLDGSGICLTISASRSWCWFEFAEGADVAANTRRAIVRAAAAIGRAMP